MKTIHNTSFQGLNIVFSTPNGLLDIFIRPKSFITVPDSYHSKILDTFVRRRLVKVTKDKK